MVLIFWQGFQPNTELHIWEGSTQPPLTVIKLQIRLSTFASLKDKQSPKLRDRGLTLTISRRFGESLFIGDRVCIQRKTA
jgi:hypothetical protein